MNTSYSNRGTARLTLLAIALAAGGVQAQAHAGSGATSEALRMRDVGRVNYPYMQGMADTVPDKRLAMVLLSASDGDMGAEMLISGDARHTIASFPKSADKAIVYANIDDLAYDKASMRAAYKLARDMGWPIYIESNFWDVKALTAHIREYFPEARKINLQSVAVRISWDKGRITVVRARPEDAAAEIGVPFSKTSRGQAVEEFNRLRALELNGTKAFATKSETYEQAGQFAMFGVESYNPNASILVWPYAAPGQVTKRFRRVLLDPTANDFMQLWKADVYNGDDGKTCIVTWRGSSTAGDWARNFESQFGFAVPIPNAPTILTAKIGRGYAARLNNHQARINGKGCKRIAFVGHSLGGGMAQAHSVSFRYLNPDNMVFWKLAAYNSARVGNSNFKALARQWILGSATTGDQLAVRCRMLDPVPSVPIGLQNLGTLTNGCTFRAKAYSYANSIANHSMDLWTR